MPLGGRTTHQDHKTIVRWSALLLLSGVLTGFPDVSDAAFLADTDGDGTIDQVEVCQTNKVCVQHSPPSGTTTTYSDPLWNTVSLDWVLDMDGQPGAEILVVAKNSSGALQCLCIIHDRNGSYASYLDPLWSAATINWVVDTDGRPGADIVFTATDSAEQLKCVCVLHDEGGAYTSYFNPVWASVNIYWAADTDGNPGADIVVEATTTGGTLECVCVIHDAVGTYASYLNPVWGSVITNWAVDTDGNPGVDILLSYASSAEGFSVIHDASQTLTTYSYTGQAPMIQQMGNYDGVAGQEICVLLGTINGYELITDRTGSHTPISDCTTNSPML